MVKCYRNIQKISDLNYFYKFINNVKITLIWQGSLSLARFVVVHYYPDDFDFSDEVCSQHHSFSMPKIKFTPIYANMKTQHSFIILLFKSGIIFDFILISHSENMSLPRSPKARELFFNYIFVKSIHRHILNFLFLHCIILSFHLYNIRFKRFNSIVGRIILYCFGIFHIKD